MNQSLFARGATRVHFLETKRMIEKGSRYSCRLRVAVFFCAVCGAVVCGPGTNPPRTRASDIFFHQKLMANPVVTGRLEINIVGLTATKTAERGETAVENASVRVST